MFIGLGDFASQTFNAVGYRAEDRSSTPRKSRGSRTRSDRKRGTSVNVPSQRNAPSSGGGDAVTAASFTNEYGERVVAFGRILPMLEPWHDPGYVKRAWCRFELFTSIKSQPVRDRHHPLAQGVTADRIDADGTDEALPHAQSENAEASEQADLDAIRALILSYPGGFASLDSTIKTHLRRWFEARGGVKVAPLRSGINPSMNGTVCLSSVTQL